MYGDWRDIATPALFAETVSLGKWTLAKHLLTLDRAITDTLTGTDGIRRLIVTMPPRHGKSELCSKYLPAWFVGTRPDKRVILASYEADFAASWGRKARTIIEDHGSMFGITVDNQSAAATNWNIAGRLGGMQTAGIGGPITGKGADLLIVDDPIKNAEEANSQTYRDKTWDWFLSTAYTRLEPNGAVIVIQTRWHEDDLAGRLLRHATSGGDPWRVVKFQAIGNDGAALWPARYNVDDLAAIKRAVGSYVWSALYQQEPLPPGGEFFKREWFAIVRGTPAHGRAIRYWDKAGTHGSGDFSTGVLLVDDGRSWCVVDVVRGQWSPGDRNRVMQQTTAMDAAKWRDYQVWTEQEPGSGGKESALITIREMAGYNVHADKTSGSKEARAQKFAAQCEAGNVRLMAGEWNAAFLDELITFPRGRHDDQVDAVSGAFNKLALAPPEVEETVEYLNFGM